MSKLLIDLADQQPDIHAAANSLQEHLDKDPSVAYLKILLGRFPKSLDQDRLIRTYVIYTSSIDVDAVDFFIQGASGAPANLISTHRCTTEALFLLLEKVLPCSKNGHYIPASPDIFAELLADQRVSMFSPIIAGRLADIMRLDKTADFTSEDIRNVFSVMEKTFSGWQNSGDLQFNINWADPLSWPYLPFLNSTATDLRKVLEKLIPSLSDENLTKALAFLGHPYFDCDTTVSTLLPLHKILAPRLKQNPHIFAPWLTSTDREVREAGIKLMSKISSMSQKTASKRGQPTAR